MSQISLASASRRRVLLAGVAAAAAFGGLTAAAQDAQAAFTLGVCGGSSAAKNQGASFANGAQTYWRTVFNSSNGCNGAVTLQSYLSNGSGNGIASMGGGGGSSSAPFINCAPSCGTANSGGGRTLPAGERDLTTAFAGTDDPPNPTQQAAMNSGGSSPSDDGLVHVIPAATGSSVIIVHVPNGCDISLSNVTDGRDPDGTGPLTGDGTGDTPTERTQRLRIPNVLLEKAFAGDNDANEWGEIAPEITGTGLAASSTAPVSNGQNAGIPCKDIPVKRIVRQDTSGTTFAFKAFLSLINPNREWLSAFATSTTWPAAGGSGPASPVPTGPTPAGGAAPSGGAFCANTAANLLCSRNGSGNGGLAAAVNASEGSIGYNDLATARSNQFEITPAASDAAKDYTFWAPLQNNPGGVPSARWFEPTSDATAHRPGVGGRGANCGEVTVRNVPSPDSSPNGDPTLGNWASTFAAGGASYPNCVLTYILAWDDNAPVYGNSADEEAKARTVKDFLTRAVLSPQGQQFANVDYSPLPNSREQPLFAYAQNGVNAIGWNKTAVASQPPAAVPPAPPAPPAPAGVTPQRTTPPVVVVPSNAFTVGSGRVNAKRTSMVFSVRVPGAGRLVALATYKNGRRTLRTGTVTVNPTGAGTARVTVKLSSAARRLLKSKRRLGLTVRFTYTPTGGQARTITKASTVRRAAKTKR